MDAILAGVLDSSVKLHLSLALVVALVADEVDANILRCVLLDLLQPVLQVLKSLVTRYVVSQKDTVSSTIENPCHRLEGLLASLCKNKHTSKPVYKPVKKLRHSSFLRYSTNNFHFYFVR